VKWREREKGRREKSGKEGRGIQERRKENFSSNLFLVA